MTDPSHWAQLPAHRTEGPTAGPDVAMLSASLWRERELLEGLLFRLTAQQRLLAAGDVRWLPRADQDVLDAVETVREHEILRAVEVDFMARTGGLSPDAALREIAESAAPPWPDLLLDHRDELRSLTAEIAAVTAENRRLLLAGERATREALERAMSGSHPTAGDEPDYPAQLDKRRASADRARILDTRA